MKISKTQKKILSLSTIYLLTLLLSVTILINGNLDSWQEKLTDRFFVKSTPKQNLIILAIDSESLHQTGSWPWARGTFALTLEKINEAKIIGIDINFSEKSRIADFDDTLLEEALSKKRLSTPIVMPVELLPREKVGAEPLSLFLPYVKKGFVNTEQDYDGITRKIENERYGFESFSSIIVNSIERRTLPKSFRIDFKGPEKTFLTIPIIDLLNDKLPGNIFKDAIVLIGATAPDLHDFQNTPFGLMPGVEIHANAIETLLSSNWRESLPIPVTILVMGIVDLIALLCIVRIRRFLLLIPSLFIVGVGVNIVGLTLFSYKIIFPNVYITLSFILISSVILLWEFIYESREKRFIQKTFQYYLMPEIIKEIVDDPSKLKLGGEKRRLTILFSDIAGFTTISEKLSPEELTHLMNEYLSAMTDIIMKNSGLVDKYIGDSVMAFWGAPVENKNQETEAVKSAIEMTNKLKELNVEWQKRGLPKISARIGINTGEAIVGNMGSSKRFNYTVMGDEVNFASRLEGINSYYGTEIMISENTKINLSKDIILREIDIIRVKGKNEPKKIFEVVKDIIDEKKRKMLDSFALGKDAYTKGDFVSAKKAFNDVLSVSEDAPSRTFLYRTEELEKTPSKENWDGIFDFKSK